MTNEDKQAIKQAILEALEEYDKRQDQAKWDREMALRSAKEVFNKELRDLPKKLIGRFYTPKPEVDEKQPH